LDRFHWRHAAFHHDGKLQRILTMWIHASIGGEHDRCAGCVRFRECLTLRLGRLEILDQKFFRPLLLTAFGIDVGPVVNIHRERDVVLTRKFNPLIVDQRCMLDRVGTSTDGLFD
jgi:hypothetical protein